MPNSIPLGSAPGIYSPNLMTGKLIPVTSKDNTPPPSQPISRPNINLLDVGSRRLVGGDSSAQSKPEVSASDLQNDPKASWVNLWSPKQVTPTTPKTMDNPPPEPPLPQTRHSRDYTTTVSKPSHRIYKPSSRAESNDPDDESIWDTFGGKIKGAAQNISDSIGAMSPMEKGVVFGGIPLALLGAYYAHKKMKQKK